AAAIPTVVVTLVILSVILVKRVRGQQLRPRKLITTPLLPMILGVGEAIPLFADPQLGPVHLHGIDYVVLVVDVALSIAIGLARGFTVRIYPKNGTTWYRYGPVTVLLWVLSIVLRIVLGVFGSRHGATTLVTSDSVLVMLGLTLLIQNVTVHTRCRAVARDRVRR
ncbi:MAG TPA: hypothetical protein VHF06_10815, partial [Pseudonocardiaceae bacterium]|nr:hypothetical protein [Pseudonocardiaceae bacterium]